MNLEKLKLRVQEKINRYEMDSSINFLLDSLDKESRFFEELLFLHADFRNLKLLDKRRTIDDQQYLFQSNKIISALLLLLSEIKEIDLIDGPSNKDKRHVNKGIPTPANALEIKIDPGTAPAELIAEYLAKISRLYKLRGGSGLEFLPDDIEENVRKKVSS